MSVLFNLGSISKMQIPALWRPGRLTKNERVGQFAQPYHYDGDEEITFATYCRGSALDKTSAQYFKAVLERPEHKIAFITDYEKQTGQQQFEEFETLYIILRDMCQEQFFQITDMYTQSLQGKMVLVVDGLWLDSDLRNIGFFIPGNSQCTEVDELHYFAPTAKFEKHFSQAMAIIDSIKFKAEKQNA